MHTNTPYKQGGVYPQLLDGDFVLFNRQPSLHKMSMMGHRIRVMPHNTFRLNVCVTPNFNADFDGDEMNMHVPQSLTTHEELRQLAWVMNQVISPRECKPIVSVVQDIALGVYRMTLPHVAVSERVVMNLTASLSRACVLKRSGPVSGQDLLSTALPPGLFTTAGKVKVADGQIQPGSGTVTKSTYQDASNGLLHAVYSDLGVQAARVLLDDTQHLVCDFLVHNGFSVGVSDLIVAPDTLKSFHKCQKCVKRFHPSYRVPTQAHLKTRAQGLIDTAVKTSETGYIQRKLVKAMEDFKIAHDGTVRNAAGCIVQYMYGEDGMDPIRIERQKLPTLGMTPAQILEKYSKDPGVKKLLEDRDFVIWHMCKGRIGDIESPVNFERILVRAAAQHPGPPVDSTSQNIERLIGLPGATPIFCILVRAYLSPVTCKLSTEALHAAEAEMTRRFHEAKADASEMVVL
ncbi:hypothetical protein CEUSTIGMA_g13548.t1 [Chlamydomonas eustigma]|uniref:DNA-directed RNA polymerase n=1 Tax=Chlamydomonas eustigma TaxID=1157962 RepID=A0A250XSV4_9CHLO|nr:hypothetical protein CEUSTIGMA_g13548.t1 [Chlamydomonas eustigma]|eukprot:GAX86135.1 hypothetical protein CEUSTIGMA_g13548.t1 [Chlamydomonas eustigma]